MKPLLSSFNLLLFLLCLLTCSWCQNTDITGCCTRVKIESYGAAGEHQSNRLGLFQLSGLFSDRPVYKLSSKAEYLFYLQSKGAGLWMVGPQVGQFNGGIANKGDTYCPEDLPNSKWKYTDGTAWHEERKMIIICDEEKVITECVYSDGVEFVGGDLPEDYGGGGLRTDDKSSVGCVMECDKRLGCNYWSWVKGQEINCFLKKNKSSLVRRSGYVSGSTSSACERNTVTQSKEGDLKKFNTNEVNGRFKITNLKWNETLKDPKSREYKDLASTIEDSIESMLRNEKELSDKVDFEVAVQKFKKGSVVCDFKVNYVNKEAWIAIPFAIKPSDVTKAMQKNFKLKKGILFQRFLIAANSLNTSTPLDHCAAKGCSHKCNYDYDKEEYVCTCPRNLQLGGDQLNCISKEQLEDKSDETNKDKETVMPIRTEENASSIPNTDEWISEDNPLKAVDVPTDLEEQETTDNSTTTNDSENVESNENSNMDENEDKSKTSPKQDDREEEENTTSLNEDDGNKKKVDENIIEPDESKNDKGEETEQNTEVTTKPSLNEDNGTEKEMDESVIEPDDSKFNEGKETEQNNEVTTEPTLNEDDKHEKEMDESIMEPDDRKFDKGEETEQNTEVTTEPYLNEDDGSEKEMDESVMEPGNSKFDKSEETEQNTEVTTEPSLNEDDGSEKELDESVIEPDDSKFKEGKETEQNNEVTTEPSLNEDDGSEKEMDESVMEPDDSKFDKGEETEQNTEVTTEPSLNEDDGSEKEMYESAMKPDEETEQNTEVTTEPSLNEDDGSEKEMDESIMEPDDSKYEETEQNTEVTTEPYLNEDDGREKEMDESAMEPDDSKFDEGEETEQNTEVTTEPYLNEDEGREKEMDEGAMEPGDSKFYEGEETEQNSEVTTEPSLNEEDGRGKEMDESTMEPDDSKFYKGEETEQNTEVTTEPSLNEDDESEKEMDESAMEPDDSKYDEGEETEQNSEVTTEPSLNEEMDESIMEPDGSKYDNKDDISQHEDAGIKDGDEDTTKHVDSINSENKESKEDEDIGENVQADETKNKESKEKDSDPDVTQATDHLNKSEKNSSKEALDKDGSSHEPVLDTDTDQSIFKPKGTNDIHEFECKELSTEKLDSQVGQIPLCCASRGIKDKSKTIYFVIDERAIVGDITKLFEENVKVVIKELMVMDISPK